MADHDVVAERADTPSDGGVEGRILSSSGWAALGFGGPALLWTIAIVVLAHVLGPVDFGVVSLASVIVVLLLAVHGGGIRTALIQRRTEIEEAAGSTFAFSLLFAAVLYAAVFFAAPALSDFFHTPRLVSVLRVLGALLLVSGVQLVPVALLERSLAFEAWGKAQLAGGVAQVGSALGLGLGGFGLWSLVVGQLAGAVVTCIYAWWRLEQGVSIRACSWPVLRGLISYGGVVSGARVLDILTTTLDNAVVGRMLGPALVGYYGLAFRFATFPSNVLSVANNLVMLPALASLQEDLDAFRRTYVVNLQRLALLVVPLGAAFVAGAEPLVVGIFGERWRPAVGPLRLLAIYGAVHALAGSTTSVFESVGRPRLTLLTALPNALILVPVLYPLTRGYGIVGTSVGMVVALGSSAIPRVLLAARVLGLRLADAAAALVSPLACGAMVAGAVLLVVEVSSGLGDLTRLALVVVVGVISYLVAAGIIARGVVMPVVAALRHRTA